MFNHVETLTRKLAEAEQSLEEKNIYIKSVKQSGAEMKLQINQLQSEKDKHSFSSVVIDGDCMPFTDELVTQGFEGGKKAAGMLRQTILEQLPELDPDMPHYSQVMIRVYANLKGLAKVYHDTQILKNVETLNDFVRGFNRGSYLCDFVDAGNGKECADEKVKENFELGLNDVHCRRVLLGGSGDNGYARLLERHLADSPKRSKILLIEGPPFERELADLQGSFQVLSLSSVFRAQKLPSVKRRVSSQLTPPTTPSTGYAAAASKASAPSTSATTRIDSPSTTTPAHTMNVVLRNKVGERVDSPLSCMPQDVILMKNRKMCNNFHLLGDCHFLRNFGSCQHKHGPKLDGKDLQALRAVARHSPCLAGLDCDDPSCIHGHRCPRSSCSMSGCKFPLKMHNTDTVVVRRVV